jgi:hypothetical protein
LTIKERNGRQKKLQTLTQILLKISYLLIKGKDFPVVEVRLSSDEWAKELGWHYVLIPDDFFPNRCYPKLTAIPIRA